jgi:DNA-binding response OmpR family regulator
VLVVCEEDQFRSELEDKLGRNQFEVTAAVNPAAAAELLKTSRFDAVVADCFPPFDVHPCRVLHEASGDHVPVVMVSRRTDAEDVVAAFQHGCHDAVTGAQLDERILATRVRRACASARPHPRPASAPVPLRPLPPDAAAGDESVLKVGRLQVWPSRYTVRVNDRRINLSAREFDLLCILVKRPNWVVSRAHLESVIGTRGECEGLRAIDNIVYRLRKKIGDAGVDVRCVRGVGYRLRHNGAEADR